MLFTKGMASVVSSAIVTKPAPVKIAVKQIEFSPIESFIAQEGMYSDPTQYRDVFFSKYSEIDGAHNTNARWQFAVVALPKVFEHFRTEITTNSVHSAIQEVLDECIKQYRYADRIGLMHILKDKEAGHKAWYYMTMEPALSGPSPY